MVPPRYLVAITRTQCASRDARGDPAIPERLAWLGCLPEGEVARVVFIVAVHIDAGTGLDTAEIAV
jgi:hypothetical protein